MRWGLIYYLVLVYIYIVFIVIMRNFKYGKRLYERKGFVCN